MLEEPTEKTFYKAICSQKYTYKCTTFVFAYRSIIFFQLKPRLKSQFVQFQSVRLLNISLNVLTLERNRKVRVSILITQQISISMV